MARRRRLAALTTIATAAAFGASTWAPPASAATAHTLYASPTVADGSGRTCLSVAAACSLNDARNKVRTLNANMTGDIVVNLLGGTYSLTAPFTLTQNATTRDSGTNGHSVIYQNYRNDTPILSGGRAITGWTVYDSAKGIYSAPAPAGVDSRQLYVNGTRQVRARGKKTGSWTETATGYTVSDTPIPGYKNLSGVELVGSRYWMQIRCPIASATSTTVTMAQPCWKNANNGDWTNVGATDWVDDWVENAYELLDQPGEWYLDRTGAVAGNGVPRLYLKPAEPATLAGSKVVLPVLETLVSATGIGTDKLRNIQFKGIRFEHATWLRPNGPEGYPTTQSGYLYYGPTSGKDSLDLFRTPGNVDVQQATNIRFEGNTFKRMGAVGLSLMKGTQDIAVVGNRFEDISSSAISIGHINDHHPATTSDYIKNVSFTNNLVTRAGAEYRDAAAVLAAYPQYTTISHNEIFDIPYTGISLGWGWGRNDVGKSNGFTTPTPMRNNTISYNYIHDVMRDLADGGPIYTQSDQPNSIINNNHLVNDGWFAVYLDEGTQNYTVIDNVIAGAHTISVRGNGATNNTVRRNYIGQYQNLSVNTTTNTVADNVWAPTPWQTGETIWPAAAQTIMNSAGIQPAYAGVKRTNLALDARVTASSTWPHPVYDPSFAVDGRIREGGVANSWLANGGTYPQTLSVDLGDVYSLSSIKQTSSETDNSTFKYRLEGSVDNSTWVTLADHTATAVPDGTTDQVSGLYRYIRMTVTWAANHHWVTSNEFEVYGTVPWDVAHAKDVTASDAATAQGHVPANAVDGLLDTSWIVSSPAYPR